MALANLCHVLHSLCLSRASRSSWCSSHAHTKTLGGKDQIKYGFKSDQVLSHLCQGDIASVSEWSDDQAICASKVLVLVVEVHICDSDHHLLQVCFEVEPVQA